LGNGNTINLWFDPWCGEPLINFVPNLEIDLEAKTSDFILNSQWNLQQNFIITFPQVAFLVQQVTIPIPNKHDELI
jgi:hypothetical protein